MTKYNLEEFKDWVVTNPKVDESKKQWFRTDKRINDPNFFVAFIKGSDIYCQGSRYNFGSDFEQIRSWEPYRKVVLEWVEEVDKKVANDKGQQLQQLFSLLFPNQSYDFEKLKQEITRFKYQEIAPQVRNEKTKFEQLLADVKTKVGNSKKIIDLLLEVQKQISENKQNNDQLAQARLEGQLTAYQSILEDNLTKEEIQNLLNKQTELQQLEEQLSSLQINEQTTAQTIQSTNPPFNPNK